MEPSLSRANVSIGCWGEHDWEGWVANELRASSNARPEAAKSCKCCISKHLQFGGEK